jgi:hypothetical protein
VNELENVKSLNLDNMHIEVTTDCEGGLMHLLISNPFEKSLGEMIHPIEVRMLIEFLEESLKQHETIEE